MSPPLPSPNLSDRTLRILTAALWLPAFPFLLSYGIKTHLLCPVLGIVPMTLSALLGIAHVHGWGTRRSRFLNIALDLFVAAYLVGILIPSWVMMSDDDWRRYDGRGLAIVGTYGTAPMVVNFFIHAYFVLREVRLSFPSHRVCPHCHETLPSSTRDRHAGVTRDGRGAYESVAPYNDKEESQPLQQETGVVEVEQGSSQGYPAFERRVEDDEAARLV